jgi:predicted translin family RNA/ssDNA-binding protein
MEQELKFYKDLLKQAQELSQAQAKRVENLIQEHAKDTQQLKDIISGYEDLCTEYQERLQQYQEGFGMDFTLKGKEKEKPEPN